MPRARTPRPPVRSVPDDDVKPQPFTHAADVAEIARPLIEKHHQHLVNVRIEYVFREKAAKARGQIVLGKARRVSGLNAFLADPDEPEFFVMEIAKDAWDALAESQRVALVDHELCHFVTDWGDDGETKLKLAPHDLEEFVSVVRRHGLWSADVQRLVKAASQLELPLEGREDETPASERELEEVSN